jgi:hypothetical protein
MDRSGRGEYLRWYRAEKKRCTALGIPMPVRPTLPKTTDVEEQRRRARARSKKYKLAHPEKAKDPNKAAVAARNKRWYYSNREEILAKEKVKRDNGARKHIIRKHLDKKKAARKAAKPVLTEEEIARKKATIRAKIRKNAWLYVKNRRKTDILFMMSYAIRRNIRRVVKHVPHKSNAHKTFTLLGIDRDGFMRHMEALFTDDMSWKNYGEWHIDHVRPIASFDLTKEENVRAVCHYTNLQPLWATDNMHKSAKWVPDMGVSRSGSIVSVNGPGSRPCNHSTVTDLN